MLRNGFKYLLLSAGCVLGVIVLLGAFTNLGSYKSYPPRSWERFDPALVKRTHSLREILREAEKRTASFATAGDQNKMNTLYHIVIERFTHSRAKHTLFSNWILWLAGQIHPTLGNVWDVESMLAKGHSLTCSQSSYVLLQAALKAGIRARHVGLNGHVVMEAWYDNEWHMYDPDAEVVPLNADGRVVSVEELAKSPELLDQYYSGIQSRLRPFIASREDNTFMSYPVGTYFEWKSQVLRYFEKAMEVLKYLLPLLLIGLGLRLKSQKRS
jgi:hypothetical protein